jgi:tetratricopeptide (TPR) repeat protein
LDATIAATEADGRTPDPQRRRGSLDIPRGGEIGRYVVLSKLGAGGMGVVYGAFDPELDRRVALKLLRPHAPDRDGSSSDTAGRARLLREAHALAKLSHPNVVAIHDVGEHEGAVWLAMEFVEGRTLGDWLRAERRDWGEVLSVMTAAAAGLQAAHAAGLIHRDFKPDNVMVGDDQRVRVMDLGLARARAEAHVVPDPEVDMMKTHPGEDALTAKVTRVGAMLGTPAYMSPEQFRGEDVDVRSDVFGFCITLWEALYGERPFAGKRVTEIAANVMDGRVRSPSGDRRVPGWLDRVCRRGLAPEPKARFESMPALLAAVEAGQARSRRTKWFAAAGMVAVLGMGVEGGRRYELAQRVQACEAEGAAIAEVWNEEVRDGVRAGLLATDVSYAADIATRTVPYFDRHAEAWKTAATRACLDGTVRERWDEETLDRARWCLDEQRMELEAVVDQLAHADAKVLLRAVRAASSLASVDGCVDEGVLARRPSPPTNREAVRQTRRTVARAEALAEAGKYEEGLKTAREAVEQAESLDWPVLSATARSVEGFLLNRNGDYPAAEVASADAYLQAAKVEAWGVAAEAAVRLISIIGYQQARHDEGLRWADHAELALTLANEPEGATHADRLNNIGLVHWAAGENEQALAFHERALAIRERTLGPEHPAVASSYGNLALSHDGMGDYVKARELFERTLALAEKVLGPEHPMVADTLDNLAGYDRDIGDYAKAKAMHARGLELRERVLGPDHPYVGTSLDNVGVMEFLLGNYEESRRLQERALAVRESTLGPEHPEVAYSLINLASIHVAMGEPAQAETLARRGVQILERAVGPEHRHTGRALQNLGEAELALGNFSEARSLAERSSKITEATVGADHPEAAGCLGLLADIAAAEGRWDRALELYERSVVIYEAHEGMQFGEPEHRLGLARALVQEDGDRARARDQAEKVAAFYRGTGEGKAKELAEVEAFLAALGAD